MELDMGKLLQDVPVAEARLTHTAVTGITSDSRRVKGGELLVCIRGSHRDGHSYATAGIQKGAAVLLVENTACVPPDVDYIVTPNTRLAEALLWNNRYDRPADGMTTVGVTGTSGKTSTIYLLREMLTFGGKSVGCSTTVGTMAGAEHWSSPNGGASLTDVAGAMTTPDPEYFYGSIAWMRDKGCDTLLYEASSQGLAMQKTDAIRPDYAIFTNLSPEHLDCHGTMEDYLAAKARLFASAKNGIVNGDDLASATLMQVSPGCLFTTCTARSECMDFCDVAAMRIQQQGMAGLSFLYCGNDAIFRVHTPLVGRYSVYNILLSTTCALKMGVDPFTIRTSLAMAHAPAGRMQRVELPDLPFTVYIDFAHTPDALEQTLVTAREMQPTHLTVLFGCGGDRDRRKRPEMGRIACTYADTVVITDDNPRTEEPAQIRQEIVSGIGGTASYVVIPDRREAIHWAVRHARAGEVLLLCGKGHEGWQIQGNEKLPFDEEAIVRDAVMGGRE